MLNHIIQFSNEENGFLTVTSNKLIYGVKAEYCLQPLSLFETHVNDNDLSI